MSPRVECVLKKKGTFLCLFSQFLSVVPSFQESKEGEKVNAMFAVVVLHVCLAALNLCDFWLGEGVEEL